MKRALLYMTIAIWAACIALISVRAWAADTSPGAREGVSSVINPERLAEVSAWIHNAKIDLERALNRISKLPISQQESSFRHAVDRILLGSNEVSNEFSVRNVLYRAVEIHEVLKSVASDPKRNAVARRLLKTSIETAVRNAPLDIQGIEKRDAAVGTLNYQPRLAYGIVWSRELVNMSFALPTNDSHLKVLMKVMGFLFNDIVNDDANNRLFANTAAALAAEWSEVQAVAARTPLEKLVLIKRIREFLESELMLAAGILRANGVSIGSFWTPGKSTLGIESREAAKRKIEMFRTAAKQTNNLKHVMSFKEKSLEYVSTLEDLLEVAQYTVNDPTEDYKRAVSAFVVKHAPKYLTKPLNIALFLKIEDFAHTVNEAIALKTAALPYIDTAEQLLALGVMSSPGSEAYAKAVKEFIIEHLSRYK